MEPTEEIVDSFRCGNDVEGRRNCSAVFKVRNPQLTTGKLPLSVRSFLNVKTGPDQLREYKIQKTEKQGHEEMTLT